MTAEATPSRLRRVFDDLMGNGMAQGNSTEYVLGLPVGAAYAGVSRTGAAALLIPLATAAGDIARAAGGCLLRPASDVEFAFGGRKWNQPAAILECTDVLVLDAFTVLALDVATRAFTRTPPRWQDVVQVVDEWHSLLSHRRDLSQDDEVGLWGEIWFLSQAPDADRLASGWTTPEGGPSDFVIGGACAEVKTSRSRLRHFISQAQADRPMGDLKAYLLSLWVGLDPELGTTLPALVDLLLGRLHDPARVLKGLLHRGYSPVDRHNYQTPFVLLEAPTWFFVEAVPRVRLADPGVSRLRYMVTLDQNAALGPDLVLQAQAHFQGAAALSPDATSA